MDPASEFFLRGKERLILDGLISLVFPIVPFCEGYPRVLPCVEVEVPPPPPHGHFVCHFSGRFFLLPCNLFLAFLFHPLFMQMNRPPSSSSYENYLIIPALNLIPRSMLPFFDSFSFPVTHQRPVDLTHYGVRSPVVPPPEALLYHDAFFPWLRQRPLPLLLLHWAF